MTWDNDKRRSHDWSHDTRPCIFITNEKENAVYNLNLLFQSFHTQYNSLIGRNKSFHHHMDQLTQNPGNLCLRISRESVSIISSIELNLKKNKINWWWCHKRWVISHDNLSNHHWGVKIRGLRSNLENIYWIWVYRKIWSAKIGSQLRNDPSISRSNSFTSLCKYKMVFCHKRVKLFSLLIRLCYVQVNLDPSGFR